MNLSEKLSKNMHFP